MKKLYGYYSGSRLFGLPASNTSDWDYFAIGTSKKIHKPKIYPCPKLHLKKRAANLDVEYLELCAYLTYLMNGFVFQIESLFIPKSFMDYLDPKFEDMVLKNRNKLIDRTRLVENFTYNVQSTRSKTAKDIERLKHLVLASLPSEKVAKGVTKLHEEYLKKGYYHKDYLHQIRIAAGILHFLKHDTYGLELKELNPDAFKVCQEIKLNPDAFTRPELDSILDKYLKEIETFNLDGDEEKWRFDAGHALDVIRAFYP